MHRECNKTSGGEGGGRGWWRWQRWSVFSRFLDASSHLYKWVCPSVHRSVRSLVRPSVRNPFFFDFFRSGPETHACTHACTHAHWHTNARPTVGWNCIELTNSIQRVNVRCEHSTRQFPSHSTRLVVWPKRVSRAAMTTDSKTHTWTAWNWSI